MSLGLDRNIVKHNPDLGAIMKSKASLSPLKQKQKSPSNAFFDDQTIHDHLDKTSFDEGDFRMTLNNFNDFCTGEMSMGNPVEHLLDQNASLIQHSQEKTLSTAKTLNPKQKLLYSHQRQATHFIAVPIKNAKFQLDNRTLINFRLHNNLDGANLVQSIFSSPKRKAMLLKVGDPSYDKSVAKSPSGSTIVMQYPSKQGSTTNQYQQPHYLKVKKEIFQKLITNNQIKRCQLEQIMFNDRVSFQNNFLV